LRQNVSNFSSRDPLQNKSAHGAYKHLMMTPTCHACQHSRFNKPSPLHAKFRLDDQACFL